MRKFVPALMIAAGAAVIFYATGADAQTTTTTTATADGSVVISVKPLIEQLQPYIISAVGAIISALGVLGFAVVNKIGKKFGFEIDAQARDSVLASAKNAASGLIAKGAVVISENGKITVPAGMLADVAKEIVEKRAPDSIAQLSMKPADVEQRIIEQIGLITAPTAPTETLSTTVDTKKPS